MAKPASIFLLAIVALQCFILGSVYASDPDMLQDICVADPMSTVKVNGFSCKTNVTADDFFSKGLVNTGNTDNLMGSLVTAANVQTIPGLNTLGVSMARIDFAVGGINPPHTHPRATEIIFVLEGTLEVGFITTANVLYTKTLNKGEVYVFPRGLVHFQKNAGYMPASVIAGFNSQLQGTQSMALTLFASKPTVSNDVLSKAFQIDNGQVEMIKTKLAPKKS